MYFSKSFLELDLSLNFLKIMEEPKVFESSFFAPFSIGIYGYESFKNIWDYPYKLQN